MSCRAFPCLGLSSDHVFFRNGDGAFPPRSHCFKNWAQRVRSRDRVRSKVVGHTAHVCKISSRQRCHIISSLVQSACGCPLPEYEKRTSVFGHGNLFFSILAVHSLATLSLQIPCHFCCRTCCAGSKMTRGRFRGRVRSMDQTSSFEICRAVFETIL